MAIQFNCPSCGAMIRVPDNAAGKKGTCPQCSEKLLVPVVVPAAMTAAPPPFSPQPVFTPQPVAATSSGRVELPRLDLSVGDASPFGAVPGLQPLASPGFPAFEPPESRGAVPEAIPQLGLPPLAVNSTDTKAASRSRKKPARKGRSPWDFIIPVVCFGVLFGFLGWSLWKAEPKLEGSLEAHSVSDLRVRPGVIPGVVSGLSESDLGEVLRHLKAEPARWASSASRMTLKGTDTGVEVTIDPGTASHFVRVEPAKNPAFRTYITQHAKQLDKPRVDSIAEHAPQLFAAWKVQFDRHDPLTDQKSHRDLVALPALVSGVGYHLEAVVRGTVHPCVYEDEEGGVYFLLPNATKSFVLQGRRVAGVLTLPAHYQVKLTGSVAAPEARDDAGKASQSKTKEAREADNEGMNPDLYKLEIEAARKNTRKKKGQSAGDALKMGLTGMLSDEDAEMSDEPASKSKTAPKSKKPGMLKADESSEEMRDEMPAKSLPKKGTTKMLPKEAMDDEMMEKDGEMPEKPKPTSKPKAKKVVE